MLDNLGDRMKKYEEACRGVLPRRLPVILRVDGRAFHTYTRGFDRPFDSRIGEVMGLVAVALCTQIQGAQFAYTQSDEISVLIHGYKRFASQPWFDNEIQKMVSVAAGIASATFTHEMAQRVISFKPAVFDARVFVLPEADVCNYFVWRQQDAVRNSVQTLARSLFSHAQCERKSCDDLKSMCAEAGQSWDDLPLHWQRGVCVYRMLELDGMRSSMFVDQHPPVFSGDRAYVERHLAVEEG